MKFHLLPFVFLSIGFQSFGQIEESTLIGHWKVKRIVKKSTNPELRGVMDGFNHATFIFFESGDFQLKTDSKAPTFQMILRMTEKSKWIFDAERQLIKIGQEEDDYSIMGIYVNQSETALEFALDESQMVFEMEKRE